MSSRIAQETSNKELGFSSFFHLVLILVSAYVFHQAWDRYLSNEKFPVQIMALGVFGSIIVYSVISFLYSLVSGEKSKGEMRKIIKKESKKLVNILTEYGDEVNNIRIQLKKVSGVMKPEGFKELAIIESLLISLESRIIKAREHARSSNIDEVHYAYTTLLDDISNADDAMHAVTSCEAIEPISLNKLKSNLDSRVAKVKQYFPVSRSTRNYAMN